MRWTGGARCGWRGAAWMPDPGALVPAARGLLPPGCAVAGADPRRLYPLWSGEDAAGMTAARRAEFSAGRHAARAALAELGRAAALPQAPDRAPVWPPGVAGSITHSADACLAAASPALRGLGLDLEPLAPLDRGLWDIVLSPDEAACARTAADPGLAALRVFSAKEAAYKAQYALSRRLFGFEVLAVAFDGDRFTATFRQTVPPFAPGDRLAGRWAQAQGHLLAACWL